MTEPVVAATVILAFANGANDNFKGVATLYGSGSLDYRQALWWATVSTLAGSLAALVLARGLVERFSGKGLVPDAITANPAFLSAVALGAAATVLLATRLSFPVSTTHALTGALIGAAAVQAGVSQVSYSTLGTAFVLPLLLSPVLALLIAAAAYTTLRSAGGRDRGGESCVCVGERATAPTGASGATALRLDAVPFVEVDSDARCQERFAGAVSALSLGSLMDRLHVLSAGAVGFARGLNDTPKILALLMAAEALPGGSGLLVVALPMAAGGLLARRVAQTMAFGITDLTRGQGFAGNVVAALLVTAASPLGFPVSTTHVSCGALFGIGLVNGQARANTIRGIAAAWVTTLPVAAALAAASAAFLPFFGAEAAR